MSGVILKPSKMPRGMWVYVGSRGIESGARQHQPRHARVGRGMWASSKQRRSRSGGISQGLHASDVACVHRARDPTSGVARHRPPSLGLQLAPGVARIATACRHRSVDVRHGLPSSPLACTQRSADVGHGLPTSPTTCTHRSAKRRWLPYSLAAYTRSAASGVAAACREAATAVSGVGVGTGVG
ncbi:hypothetical protein H5410_004710 [Solanum commersonii]|uniref:Uncharacterized protein n=1 Tax=Solanum commersonii TaxID=4109 RepID=A0A9J6A5L9_SOLCO|nr:hypothetical protein H5410_004710 [Solanum commersonii]